MANTNTNNGEFNQMMATFGQGIAEMAIQQEHEANEAWNQIKTQITLARRLGREAEVIETIFAEGAKKPQRKPLWYRKAKRVVKLALEQNVDFTRLSLRDTERKLSDLRRSQRSRKDREADALRMVQRTMKGALERAGEKRVLAAVQAVAPKPQRSTSRATTRKPTKLATRH